MTTHSLHLRGRHETVRDRSERSVLARLRERFAAMLKHVEYAQTVRALNSLPDHVLAEVKLRRSEIPARAHSLIYGGD